MTHAEIETRLVEIVAVALHMGAPDALRVHRLLRDAADDLLRIIAVAPLPMTPTPAPPPSPEVASIRPGTASRYVSVPKAAEMLGMSRQMLYTKLEDAPFKHMLFNNGLRKRLFVREALEAFIRQRPG
jgi:hypothetical protein